MVTLARTRAEVDLNARPRLGSGLLDRLATDCLVEITEDLNTWVKIKPVRLVHGTSGYVPREALVFPLVSLPPVFPDLVNSDGNVVGPSVPPTIKVVSFLDAVTSGDRPGWVSEEIWAGFADYQRLDFWTQIRAVSTGNQVEWAEWIDSLIKDGRLIDALMGEWITKMEGGRDVFALRDHYIYKQPVQDNLYWGSALKGQIMHWTGVIRGGVFEGVQRNFYEVVFFRMNRAMRGWFRADLCAPYQFPSADDDPAIDGNGEKVFNLSVPVFRLPQDSVISEAKKRGYSAAQYIDVFDAIGKHLIHYSLCGQFCVAALGGVNVIPLLRAWLQSSYRQAGLIMANPKLGTTLLDLQSLLSLVGLKGETYSTISPNPYLVKERLDVGQYAIVGCGINSYGKIKADGKIRHWVVLEDVVPSGNSGWVRIYNPFTNREEVYNYTLFLASIGLGTGLWILPGSLGISRFVLVRKKVRVPNQDGKYN